MPDPLMPPDACLNDPALTRGATLQQDLQALRALGTLLRRPDVQAHMDAPADAANVLRYLLAQSTATFYAVAAWQEERLAEEPCYDY
jgi:hypothetical protein